ncbi:MAG: sigma-70 family RNA polymerase sigma factor [bacterium]|nr:sigma-70 family RNA polymerase sigma factor [bacterium]
MYSTELLHRAARGDAHAASDLYEHLYQELHRRAHALMVGAAPGHTLQPTVLVHEAWLRLSLPDTDWEGRSHFLGVATRAMRSVLVDHARARLAPKRGGHMLRVELSEQIETSPEPAWRIVALDEALAAMETKDSALQEVAHLRLFGGLSHGEIAELLHVSERTVERRWRAARKHLEKALADDSVGT